jgi:DNA-binding GntR family transcriptional regulator
MATSEPADTTVPAIDAAAVPDDAVTEDASGYEPLAATVVRSVREAILSGRLAPGDRIRQEDFAKRLGTSRIPVREALRHLEAEGLVTLVPHSGARVAVMDFAGFSELYRIREEVEPIAIEESAPRLSDEQIHELRELLAVVESSADTDVNRWLEFDRRFHLASYAAAPLPQVLSMIERFWNQTQQYRRAFLSAVRPVNLGIVGAEHLLIMDALARRDGKDAAALQRLHIRRTRNTLANRPEFFDA